MARTALAIFSVLWIVSAAPDVVAARDVVTVRFLSGHSEPDRSSEYIDLRIERFTTGFADGTQRADQFFDAVRKVLRENQISNDWSFVLPDGPSTEITITIDGASRKMLSAHLFIEEDSRMVATEDGAEPLNGRDRKEVLSRQSEDFLRHRVAFERILTLVAEHLDDRLL